MPKKKRPIPKKLPAKLRAIRRRAGFKQYEMRRVICSRSPAVYEYSNSPISEYEAGRRAPSLAELLDYAKFGGVTAEYLIDDEAEFSGCRSSNAGGEPRAGVAEQSAKIADEIAPDTSEKQASHDTRLGSEDSRKNEFSKTSVRLRGRALSLIEEAYSDIDDVLLLPEAEERHQREERRELARQKYFEVTVGAAIEMFFEESNEKFAALWQQVWQRIIEDPPFLDERED